MSKRSLWLVVLLVSMAAAVGWFAGRQLAPPEVTPVADPPLVTMAVEERVLEEELVTRGTVSFAAPVPVPVVAEGLVTSLPVVGHDIVPGAVLMTVGHRPVIAVESEFVFTDDLSDGSWGVDVVALQSLLTGLGYDPGEIDGRFSERTAEAVTEWYLDLGFVPRTAESLASGDISAVLAFELDGERDGLASRLVNRGVVVPAGELVTFESLPLRVRQVSARVGEELAAEDITVSGIDTLVTAPVPLADAADIADNAGVVVDEPGLLEPVDGRVTAKEPVADSPGSINLVVTPDTALGHLVGASVRVSIPRRSTGGAVLAVPLAAVSAGGDSGGVVEVAEGETTRLVEVDLGIAAEGFVAVTPQDPLQAGDMVVVRGER